MTPRQEAAIRKRIARLQAQSDRAFKPINKALDAIGQKFRKDLTKLEKARDRKAAPILRRNQKVLDSFEKKIGALRSKLR